MGFNLLLPLDVGGLGSTVDPLLTLVATYNRNDPSYRPHTLDCYWGIVRVMRESTILWSDSEIFSRSVGTFVHIIITWTCSLSFLFLSVGSAAGVLVVLSRPWIISDDISVFFSGFSNKMIVHFSESFSFPMIFSYPSNPIEMPRSFGILITAELRVACLQLLKCLDPNFIQEEELEIHSLVTWSYYPMMVCIQSSNNILRMSTSRRQKFSDSVLLETKAWGMLFFWTLTRSFVLFILIIIIFRFFIYSSGFMCTCFRKNFQRDWFIHSIIIDMK